MKIVKTTDRPLYGLSLAVHLTLHNCSKTISAIWVLIHRLTHNVNHTYQLYHEKEAEILPC